MIVLSAAESTLTPGNHTDCITAGHPAWIKIDTSLNLAHRHFWATGKELGAVPAGLAKDVQWSALREYTMKHMVHTAPMET